MSLGLALEHANYSTERYAGNFTGVHLGVSYAQANVHGLSWDVSAGVPAYQLVRNGQDEGGIGDPWLRGRLRLLQSRARDLALGAALGMSFPLGDAEADLGMGHVMIHPTVWLDSAGERVHTHWTFSYGSVLGAGDHGSGTGPLVNPMNASELAASGTATWSPVRGLQLSAGAMGAVPTSTQGGEARAVASLGFLLPLGLVQLGSEFSWAILGDPFDQKLEVTARAAF
jgi:hypothetical protein